MNMHQGRGRASAIGQIIIRYNEFCSKMYFLTLVCILYEDLLLLLLLLIRRTMCVGKILWQVRWLSCVSLERGHAHTHTVISGWKNRDAIQCFRWNKLMDPNNNNKKWYIMNSAVSFYAVVVVLLLWEKKTGGDVLSSVCAHRSPQSSCIHRMNVVFTCRRPRALSKDWVVYWKLNHHRVRRVKYTTCWEEGEMAIRINVVGVAIRVLVCACSSQVRQQVIEVRERKLESK